VLYIPSANKPIRITSLQSVVGGVFNNADIMQLGIQPNMMQQFKGNCKEDFLDLKAKNKTVAYDKLKMWITKADKHFARLKLFCKRCLLKHLSLRMIKILAAG